MKPVFQTIFGKPLGNCMQAAIASILELELDDVPNFSEHEDQWDALVEYLSSYGLMPLGVTTTDEDGDKWTPLGWHLIAGGSPRGDFAHIVVGYQGGLIHDPHPEGDCELTSIDHYIVFITDLEDCPFTKE